jgi:hypothetical protein
MHNPTRVQPTPPAPAPDDDDTDPVPIFGSWRAIYTAVIATAVLWIVLAALFSRWPF